MTRKLIELINSDCNSRESVLTVQQISKLFYNAIKIIFKYTNAMRTFFKLKICNTYWISANTSFMCNTSQQPMFWLHVRIWNEIPILSLCNNDSHTENIALQ